jgi:nucleoid DNA-binding protein
MLNKSELINELVERGAGDRQHVRNMLEKLADVVYEQLEAGEDVVIPSIVKLSYDYKPAVKKGEKYKKGETYVGFGGVETVAEADSKPRSRSVRLVAKVTGDVAKLKPGQKAEAQREFFAGRTGKALLKRKSG